MNAPEPAPACTLVIFGAGGDLTKRLLMPALYDLADAGRLNDGFSVLGLDRNEGDDEGWRNSLTGFLHDLAHDPKAEFNAGAIDENAWNFVRSRLHYMKADFTRDETFAALGQRLKGNVVFYFAVPSRFFEGLAEKLGGAGLLRESDGAFRRVVIEKPFGSDLQSARALDAKLLALANEEQFFRIDHFMGKETVQNILALRFANRLFEPVWSAEHIDHVQITAAEVIGVEGRGSFYEPTGALRDMVPNHLFQMLCMTAMEAPASFDAKAVRDAKAALVAAIRPAASGDAVRGQYGAGTVNGTAVPAYRAEPGVAPDSCTETYAALKLAIDTPRWQGVPFYLRTGKRLTTRQTEVVIRFKPPSHSLLRDASGKAPEANLLRLTMDGDKGVFSSLQVKVPGPATVVAPVVQGFRDDAFFKPQPNVGYETLLYDCMTGDATLFQRADAIEGSWAVVEPVLDAWKAGAPESYAAGSAGPKGSDDLLARDGRAWEPLHSTGTSPT